MHHDIRFIVEADNKVEARGTAEGMGNELCEIGTIDYFNFYNSKGEKVIFSLSSDEGAKWLLAGLAVDYGEFERSFEKVKEIIMKKTPDDVYDESSMDLYYFRKCDKPEFICIQDFGLGHASDVTHFIANKDIKKIWVVVADVHT